MGLGDMNGFELAAVLNRYNVYRSIPILGTIVFPGRKIGQHCLAAGCDDFISKPFPFTALHTGLTQLVYGEDRARRRQPGYETAIESRT